MMTRLRANAAAGQAPVANMESQQPVWKDELVSASTYHPDCLQSAPGVFNQDEGSHGNPWNNVNDIEHNFRIALARAESDNMTLRADNQRIQHEATQYHTAFKHVNVIYADTLLKNVELTAKVNAFIDRITDLELEVSRLQDESRGGVHEEMMNIRRMLEVRLPQLPSCVPFNPDMSRVGSMHLPPPATVDAMLMDRKPIGKFEIKDVLAP